MRLLKVKAGLLTALAAVSLMSTRSMGYDGYRHQKTVGALPKGAPLPDCESPKNDKITAQRAYKEAGKCLRNHSEIEASEFFERAICALRRDRKKSKDGLRKRLVMDYVVLLRAHKATDKANGLEKEFLREKE